MTHPTIAPPLASGWVLLGRRSDFQGTGPFAAASAGVDLVVVNSATGLRAFAGRCPHQGALLGEGEMAGSTLICRNHGWRFDGETGQRLQGPQCLRAYPLELRGDEVWVNVAGDDATTTTAAATRTLDDLPGPRSLPLVGNMHQLQLGRLHLILEDWARRFGSPYLYRMGMKRVVVFADAETNEQILRDRPDTYRRTSIVQSVFEEMGTHGVFSAEGESWRPQRRLAMQALAHRQLRGFYDALQMVAARLVRRWQGLAEAGAVVDVVEELKRFTVDVTTIIVFGYDVNTIEQSDDVIQRKLELIFPTFNRRLFALLPTWRWLRMPADRRVDRALAELREWLSVRVQEARARLASDPARAEQPENFIESMLTARDAHGQPFSEEAIFGNAMTMLLAGEDTTAFTLAWTVHHLCDEPAVVARLQAEADTMLGDAAVAPDLETTAMLNYAGAVANEAMRLRPVAPLIFVDNTRPVVVDGIAVPPDTRMCLLTRPPAIAAQNFSEPSRFLPERWLDATDATRAHEPGALMPFGTGPRICPGRSLALLEMKLVLSSLYKAVTVARVGSSADVSELFAFTMSPAGLKVQLRRRA